MKIFVSQIYVEVGVSYPFSHRFQKYLSEELSKRISASDTFVREYAEDFDVVFNVSAKADIMQPEIKGPTVFRKDKDVEFTVFLPFDKQEPHGQDAYRRVLRQLIHRVVDVLKTLEMDVSQLSRDSDEIVEGIVTDPTMIVTC